MKPADRDDERGRSRIVSLKPSPVKPSPVNPGDALVDLVRAAVVEVTRVRGLASCGRGSVRVTCDVDPQLAIPGPAPLVRDAVRSLLADVVAAAAAPRQPSDFPVADEVVVTAVDTGLALEIEFADSGDAPATYAVSTALTTAVARLGGSVSVQACPEGGRAVTLCFPHRRARGLAA
jgi:hypothetical protein